MIKLSACHFPTYIVNYKKIALAQIYPEKIGSMKCIHKIVAHKNDFFDEYSYCLHHRSITITTTQ